MIIHITKEVNFLKPILFKYLLVHLNHVGKPTLSTVSQILLGGSLIQKGPKA